ncbi:MAG TPA: hypothetical protein VGS19_09920 [Streptosporangiaceae bacterium]|nr:hypothetical protein [Streptosporangiaceae bacterium]
MLDKELREQLAAWARPLEQGSPPDVSVIRHRARKRAIRLAAGSAGVAVGALALIVLGGLTLGGQNARGSKPSLNVSAPATLAEVPFYVSIESQGNSAAVHLTVSGRVIGSIKPQRGTSFVGVAAAGDDRTFALAADTGPVIRFYGMHLDRGGHPGPLETLPVRPVQEQRGSCHAQLGGLALAPDGQTLAVSTLSDCASGIAGPSEIAIVSLPSGRLLNTFRPGNGYPESLSWTADGTLAYDWAGPQPGVWLIRSAPSSRPRLLVPGSAGLGRYSGAQHPMITPDGSAVIATLGRGRSLEVAEFSARTGQPVQVLVPAVANPAQYCGPLWTDRSGQHLLAACGDSAEASINNGRLTRLPPRWQLPSYLIPSGPQIAW